MSIKEKWFCFALLFVLQISAQEIKVKIDSHSKNYTWGMLYKYEKGLPVYLTNTEGKKNKFTFRFETPIPNGVYRFVYALRKEAFVDFFYDGNDVHLEFHPRYPIETLQFKKSAINTDFMAYQNQNYAFHNQLDSIQGMCFRRIYPQLKKAYQEKRKAYLSFQESSEKKSSKSLVRPFVESSNRTFSAEPFQSLKEYIRFVEAHTLTEKDINNSHLLNSSFLNDKVLAYVFDMYVSRDPIKQDSLHKRAIEKFFLKVKTPIAQRKYAQLILEELKAVGTLERMQWVLESYYKTLPEAYQDANYLEQFSNTLRLAIGADAPDLIWKEAGQEQSFKKVYDASAVLLVFWSAECSHCREEIPKVYQQTNKIPNLKVLAIGVEERAKFWDTDHKTFPKWKHLLGLGKWQNEWAQTYEVESTPTYILIDEKGKIKAKPNDLNALNLALRSIQ